MYASLQEMFPSKSEQEIKAAVERGCGSEDNAVLILLDNETTGLCVHFKTYIIQYIQVVPY